jgi:hypothetical protein
MDCYENAPNDTGQNEKQSPERNVSTPEGSVVKVIHSLIE